MISLALNIAIFQRRQWCANDGDRYRSPQTIAPREAPFHGGANANAPRPAGGGPAPVSFDLIHRVDAADITPFGAQWEPIWYLIEK